MSDERFRVIDEDPLVLVSNPASGGSIDPMLIDTAYAVTEGPVFQWDDETSYPPNDLALHQGQLYMASADAAVGQEPGVAPVWTPAGVRDLLAYVADLQARVDALEAAP